MKIKGYYFVKSHTELYELPDERNKTSRYKDKIKKTTVQILFQLKFTYLVF